MSSGSTTPPNTEVPAASITAAYAPATAPSPAVGKKGKGKDAAGGAVDKKAEKAARRAAKIAGRPTEGGTEGGGAATGGGGAGGRPAGKGQAQGGAGGAGAGGKQQGGGQQQQQRGGSHEANSGSSANISLSSAPSGGNQVGAGGLSSQQTGASGARLASHAYAPSALSGPMPHLIVSHLPGPRPSNSVAATVKGDVHPAVIKLGLQLREGSIRGANARLVAGLSALKQVIASYTTPQASTLPRDLTAHLSPQIAHLTQARPMPVGLGNAIRWLKKEISTVSIDEAEADSKALLIAKIDEYIREKVTLSGELIVEFAKEKIKDGGVVLTYARSSIVEKVLVRAHREMSARGESFSVVIVDSRPLLEGKNLLLSLTSHSIACTYVHLPALPSVLPRVSLVLLGTSALLSNGALYARAGTASVALLANARAVPVVVCCETYKFGEKVQLDAVVANEMGETRELLKTGTNHPLKETVAGELPQAMQLINLLYDLTPPELVSAVCTEYGFIPPSSVPSVLSRDETQAD